MNKEDTQSLAKIFDLIHNVRLLQALYVICKFEIPDVIDISPQSLQSLADFIDVDEHVLSSIIAVCTAFGFLKVDSNLVIRNTRKSRLLKSDVSVGLRYSILKAGCPPFWLAWGKLHEMSKVKSSGFRCANGTDAFTYFKTNAESRYIFSNALRSSSLRSDPLLLKLFSYDKYRSVTDIGGGTGVFLQLIKKKFPEIHCILFETEEVVKIAKGYKDKQKIEYVCGDLFQSEYPHSEIFILKKVLHDWSDDICVQILSNCKKKLAKDGKILIFEIVRTKKKRRIAFEALANLEMLVMTEGGSERSKLQFKSLLDSAGLKLEKAVGSNLPISLLIASHRN